MTDAATAAIAADRHVGEEQDGRRYVLRSALAQFAVEKNAQVIPVSATEQLPRWAIIYFYIDLMGIRKVFHIPCVDLGAATDNVNGHHVDEEPLCLVHLDTNARRRPEVTITWEPAR